MEKEELFEAIGEIDDRLVLRKTSKKKGKLTGFATTFIVSAACLSLVIGVQQMANRTSGFGKVPIISEPVTSAPAISTPETQFPIIGEKGEYLVPAIYGEYGCGDGEGINPAEYIDLNQAGIAPLSDENADDGINYGPVIPMTFTMKNNNIEAERDITYDFTDSPANGIVTILDEYVLTNTSGEAQSLTYLYPYIGYREEILKHKPVVIMDDMQTTPAISNGIYSYITDGYISDYLQLSSMDDYYTMLKESVADTVPKVDEGIMNDMVTVYEYDYPYVEVSEYPCTLFKVSKEYMNSVYCVNMSLQHEDEMYIYYGYVYEDESNYKETGQFDHKAMLIFMDDAPASITAFSADLDEDTWDYTPVGEINVESKVYECSFKELATELVDTKLQGSEYASDKEYKALLIDKLMIMISDSVAFRRNGANPETEYYMISSLNNLALFVDVASRPFGFYLLEDTVTVPAGGSVKIRFEYDRIGKYWEEPEEKYKGIFGYDNCPNLGTNITFTSQSAAIADKGDIEIIEQNYGFDLKNNIRKVELKLDAERYYMYVKFMN